MRRIPKRREIIFLTAALLIAGAAVLPLWEANALLNSRGGGDSPFLLQRVHQMVAALQDGHFPVRWMPDANYGHGYPFFNFYAPLSIYVAAAFRLIGFTLTRSIQLAQLSGFLVAGWGMFALARAWGWRDGQAFLASVAYTTAPFHLVNVYVRGDSLAEFWAMAFYPLTLLAAKRLLEQDRFSAETLLPLSLSYAGLVLSHNISALIFTPFLGFYILCRALPQPNRVLLLRNALLAGILGVMLSAWFWMPALAEQDLVQLGPVTEGYFHYSGHFLGENLVQQQWRFDYDVTTAQNPFRMGLVQALLIGAAVILFAARLIWSHRVDGHNEGKIAGGQLTFVLVLFGLATLMLLPQSTWLWENVPLLEFTQFPWRFLSVQALFGSLLIGSLLPARMKLELPLSMALAILLVWSAFGALRVDFLYLTDENVSAEKLAQYEWFTGNIGTTISAEYLPHSVQPRPWASRWLNSGERDVAAVLSGDANANPIRVKTNRHEWRVEVQSESATVVFPLLYFDGWHAELDDTQLPLNLSAATGSGLAQLELPAGDHVVTLRLKRTPVRQLAESVALLAVMMTVWVGRGWIKQQQRTILWLGAGLLIVMVGVRMSRSSAEIPAIESWDFAQLGYLHRNDSIPFTNGMTLQTVVYPREQVTAGDTAEITTHWAEGDRGDVTLLLTTPAIHRATERRSVPVFASQTTAITDGVAHFVLQIPQNAPAGLFVPQLQWPDAVATTASGLARGTLFLKPIRILAAPQPATVTDIAADVTAAQWLENGDLLLNGRWATASALDENYQATWRVYDRFGRFYAELDTQPGYGYLPSSVWPQDQWVNDWIQLPWLADDGEGIFTVVASLHDVTGRVRYQERVAQISLDRELPLHSRGPFSTEPPSEATVADIDFGQQIALNAYLLEQSSEEVVVTLYWQALRGGLPSYRHFVHLVDTTSGEVVTQHDGKPQFSTHPTNNWRQDEIVDDLAVLFLDNVPAGTYEIRVGLYQNLGDQFPRLEASDTEGNRLQDDTFVLPSVIIIP